MTTGKQITRFGTISQRQAYKMGLMAGLRWALGTALPHYRGALGIECEKVNDAICCVERTGELPKD